MNLYIKISEIDFSKSIRFNPNTSYLAKEIKKAEDLRNPVEITIDEHGKPIEIVDGYLRAKLFQELGIEYIPAIVWIL